MGRDKDKYKIIKVKTNRDYKLIYDVVSEKGYTEYRSFNIEEDRDWLARKLSISELKMLDQIKEAQGVGSSMLVVTGLRSIIESLVNKICVRKKIITSKVVSINGKDQVIEIKLMAKFIKIRGFIKDDYAKETIYNIINKANLCLHELMDELEKTSSRKYLEDFIIILKTEKIFNNLNLKNEPTITTASSSDQSI